MTSKKYKILGEIFLAIPIIFFLIFAVGEVGENIASGLSHFIQMVPVVVFAILAWNYPKKTGYILSTLAVILTVLYFLPTGKSINLENILIPLILFVPPFIAGVFFIKSEKY